MRPLCARVLPPVAKELISKIRIIRCVLRRANLVLPDFRVEATALLAFVTRGCMNHLGTTRGHTGCTNAGTWCILVPKLRRFVTNEAIFGVFTAADTRIFLVQKTGKSVAAEPKLPVRVASRAESFKGVDHMFREEDYPFCANCPVHGA